VIMCQSVVTYLPADCDNVSEWGDMSTC
jgi:hypothetical protein